MDKELSEFNENKSKKDGFNSLCKSCIAVYQKKYYQANKKTFIDNKDKRKKTIKKWIIDFKKDKGCIVCGENRPATLDFHHRNPDEKETEIMTAVKRGWSINRLQKEIDKCDIMCSNCHRVLHWKER